MWRGAGTPAELRHEIAPIFVRILCVCRISSDWICPTGWLTSVAEVWPNHSQSASTNAVLTSDAPLESRYPWTELSFEAGSRIEVADAPRTPGVREHPHHAGSRRRGRQSRDALFDRQGQLRDAAPGDESVLSVEAAVSVAARRHDVEIPRDVRVSRRNRGTVGTST